MRRLFLIAGATVALSWSLVGQAALTVLEETIRVFDEDQALSGQAPSASELERDVLPEAEERGDLLLSGESVDDQRQFDLGNALSLDTKHLLAGSGLLVVTPLLGEQAFASLLDSVELFELDLFDAVTDFSELTEILFLDEFLGLGLLQGVAN